MGTYKQYAVRQLAPTSHNRHYAQQSAHADVPLASDGRPACLMRAETNLAPDMGPFPLFGVYFRP